MKLKIRKFRIEKYHYIEMTENGLIWEFKFYHFQENDKSFLEIREK